MSEYTNIDIYEEKLLASLEANQLWGHRSLFSTEASYRYSVMMNRFNYTVLTLYEDGIVGACCYVQDMELYPDNRIPFYKEVLTRLREEYPELSLETGVDGRIEARTQFRMDACDSLDDKIYWLNEMFSNVDYEICEALEKRLYIYHDVAKEAAEELGYHCARSDLGSFAVIQEDEVCFKLYELWPGKMVLEWNSDEILDINQYEQVEKETEEVYAKRYPDLAPCCGQFITEYSEWITQVYISRDIKVDEDPIKAKPQIYEAMRTFVPQLCSLQKEIRDTFGTDAWI